MISKIWASNLDEQGYTSDKTVNGKPYLEISKINLIIGENNSGESRLMRLLFSEKVSFLMEKINFLKEYEILIEKVRNLESVKKNAGILKPIECGFTHINEHKANIEHFFDVANQLIKPQVSREINNDEVYSLAEKLNNLLKSSDSPIIEPEKYYLLILRGMRPFDLLIEAANKDILKERTITDYFALNEYYNSKITTGYALYEMLRNFLLGQPEEREIVRNYEKLLGDVFFNGKKLHLYRK